MGRTLDNLLGSNTAAVVSGIAAGALVRAGMDPLALAVVPAATLPFSYQNESPIKTGLRWSVVYSIGVALSHADKIYQFFI